MAHTISERMRRQRERELAPAIAHNKRREVRHAQRIVNSQQFTPKI